MQVPLLANDFVAVYESPNPSAVYAYTPGLVRLPGGRLVATMDQGGPGVRDLPGPKGLRGEGPNAWQGLIFTSDDRGHSWTRRAIFPFMQARPFVAGRSLYVLGHAGDLAVIRSDDEGETWSEPRELPGALTSDRHTAKYAPDGRLVVTFRDMAHESPTHGDWVAWVGTYDDIVNGNEGQYRVRLMDNLHGADCAYPGLELLPNGTFVTTTYGHWTKGAKPYIISVRFKLEELEIRS